MKLPLDRRASIGSTGSTSISMRPRYPPARDHAHRQSLAFAAIDSVELVPRKMAFRAAAGRQFVGKRDEYRRAVYAHAPSAITYQVFVPEHGRLSFGLGVAERNKPVTFRILAGADRNVLFSQTLDDPDAWTDSDVDLSAYRGRSTKLVFETSSGSLGAVGLWSNPLLTNDAPRVRPTS